MTTNPTEQRCICTGTSAGLNACAECPTPWPDIPGATRSRRETTLPTAAPAAVPPADRVGLRDRIAGALSEARRPGLGGMTEADAVAYMADAVLRLLFGPIPAGTDTATWTAIRAIQLMNEAGRERDASAEERRLALSSALGLGTGAPWDAIRERAAELAALPAPVDRAVGTDRLYAWAHDIDTDEGDVCIPGVRSSGTGPEAIAIVVHREDMPVLAGMLAEAGDAPVDRGAVLREAADELDAHAAQLVDTSDDPAVFVAKARARAAIEWRVAAALLRRLAEDATPVAPSAATPNGTGAAVAASGDRPAVLTEPERQFLTLALDLAADQMASRGDEFGDEDTAALDTLRHLAAETPTAPPGCWYNAEAAEESMDAESMAAETPGPETQGVQLPCQCGHGEAYHDFKYGGPRCRLCPESGEWTWRHAFRSAVVSQPEEAEAPSEPVHARPGPDDNGISPCCGRPPFEFRGERLTRDPAAVTCTAPPAVAEPGKEG